MLKSILIGAAVVAVAVSLVSAQQPAKKAPLSPPAETSVTIAGKAITIKYSAPSVRGRQIFGDGGLISKDKTYPVWRAGANSATAFHTDADLDIKGLAVPEGRLHALRPGERHAVAAHHQQADRPVGPDLRPEAGPRPRAMDMSKPAGAD